MAFSEGSQRRKRAWRKPREEIGPGIIPQDTSSSIDTASTKPDHLKPKRINRTTLKEPISSSEPVSTLEQSSLEPISSSEPVKTMEQSSLEPISSSEPVSTLEQSSPEPTSTGSVSMDQSCGPGEEGLNSGLSVTVGGAEAPLIIDGSVMEGVRISSVHAINIEHARYDKN